MGGGANAQRGAQPVQRGTGGRSGAAPGRAAPGQAGRLRRPVAEVLFGQPAGARWVPQGISWACVLLLLLLLLLQQTERLLLLREYEVACCQRSPTNIFAFCILPVGNKEKKLAALDIVNVRCKNCTGPPAGLCVEWGM